MSSANKQMGVRDWLTLLWLSVLWGGSFFFVELALRGLPPFTLGLLRVSLAALVLLPVALIFGGEMPRSARAWRAFAGMALLNNAIPFALLTWGQTQIASGLASILNATTPLWAVVCAHWLTFDERAGLTKIVGTLLGFAGVVLMIGFDALRGAGENVAAQLACLAAALSYALAGLFGRRFRTMGITPLATAAGQLTAASALLLPLALIAEQPWRIALPPGEVWAAVAGLVLLSTCLAYLLYFRLLASAGATNLLLVTFLIPVTAMLLGWLLLAERLQSQHLAGMVMVGAGLIWIDGRLPRQVRTFLVRKGESDPDFYRGRDI